MIAYWSPLSRLDRRPVIDQQTPLPRSKPVGCRTILTVGYWSAAPSRSRAAATLPEAARH